MRWALLLWFAVFLSAFSGSATAPSASPSAVGSPAVSTTTLDATISPTVAVTATPPNSLLPIDAYLLACPPAADVAALNASLPLLFDSDPTAPTLVCRASAGSADLTLMQRRVYNILRVMQRLNFAKPLPWTDRQLYTWFVGAVKGISFRGDTTFSSCCKPEHVIIIPTSPTRS